MVTIKLYVEGGGDSDSLHRLCRQSFRIFLEKAGFKGRMPRIVACGGRLAAYDHFKTSNESGETSLLLIDSEDFVASDSPWMHLANPSGDGFTKPENATDEHCHFMVVCMESWFLADKEALISYFGQGFNETALPQNSEIEAISKKDIYDGLHKASSKCKTKAPYGKGKHSFDILLKIDPGKVCKASFWAKRFLETLDAIAGNDRI
ncbi:MAG: DUF4276 family protein [Candidatus Omnitrophota bacterium]